MIQKKSIHWNVVAAVALIVVGIGYLVASAATSEGITYRTVEEVRNGSPLEFARLTGHVGVGSIKRAASERGASFALIDAAGDTIVVTYAGIVPDTLRDRSEAVVSGKYDSAQDQFVASDVLAKCPSKYEGKYDTHVRTVAPAPPGKR